MIINVAIPVYNPDKRLFEIVNRLNKQTMVPEKILLINTGSSLDYAGDYAQFNNVEILYIKEDEFDHGGTRDMAMRKLSGDYVIFMTQDAMPVNNRLIEKLIVPMIENDEIAVTYARQLPAKNAGVIEKYTRAFNYGEEDVLTAYEDVERLGIKTFFCSDVCAAYRKSCYDEVGGFPGKTIFNEDMIYAWKALTESYKKLYVADATVVHSHNYDALKQFKRNFDLGVSHKQFSYIFDSGLKTENEGIRLVLDTTKYLIDTENYLLLPKLYIDSAAKYLGYRMGKLYDKLPDEWVEKFTMNKNYWR